MQYATGTYDRLLYSEQTERYPWLLQPAKTDIKIDKKNGRYSENCNMYRDFETTYSDVPLKHEAKLKLNFGYKVYDYLLDKKPLFEGHKLNVEWKI